MAAIPTKVLTPESAASFTCSIDSVHTTSTTDIDGRCRDHFRIEILCNVGYTPLERYLPGAWILSAISLLVPTIWSIILLPKLSLIALNKRPISSKLRSSTILYTRSTALAPLQHNRDMALNLSCPAVSHNWRRTIVPLSTSITRLVRKFAPTVEATSKLNVPFR